MIVPTETQVLKHMLIKKGIFTEEEWTEGRKEVAHILKEQAARDKEATDKFIEEFINS